MVQIEDSLDRFTLLRFDSNADYSRERTTKTLRGYMYDYRFISQTRYGPMVMAAVKTIMTLSTVSTYGAIQMGASASRQRTA
jgi:hypothetical protein